jgi:methionyl-tRNA formyltransferase
MNKLTLGFAGTPAFGLPALEAIHQAGHHLKAVYTQPDRPAGRGRKLQESAIKEWAKAHQIPVYQPVNFKDDNTVQALSALKLDLLIVIAYGLILPTRVLSLPRLGCINVHASLLPRWRGASPIQQAILHGDKETGVNIMQMDKGMDTGAILNSMSIPIEPHDTTGSLHDKLAQLAVQPLLDTLSLLAHAPPNALPQDGEHATYAPKITKEKALILWHESTQKIDQKIRAYNPWPIAYTQLNDTIIRIHEAQKIDIPPNFQPGTILSIDKSGIRVATGDGIIKITRIQFPGGKAISVSDWLHANRNLAIGMTFQ